MAKRDYLPCFAVLNRAIWEGLDERQVIKYEYQQLLEGFGYTGSS